VNRSAGLPGGIVDLEVDPRNRDVVYAVIGTGAGGAKVFRSVNAGVSWTDITGTGIGKLPNIPTWKLVIDPRYGDLYVGNDDGVYRLADGSSTWTRFGAGLPHVQVKDLELNQNLNLLTAATYGRSAFQVHLDFPNLGPAAVPTGALRAESGSSVWA